MVQQSAKELWQVIAMPNTQYDLVVVGAGPAGCHTSQIVAKAGYKVLVVEEHAEVGVPTQCTGLVSEKIGKIPDEIVVNIIDTARFFCGETSFDVKPKEDMILIDRRAFDKFIYKQAAEAGAEFKFNTRFLGYEKNEKEIDKGIEKGIEKRIEKRLKVKTTNGNFETKVLVGADGPNSAVAKSAKIKQPKNLLYLMQVRARLKFDPEVVELWFGNDIAPGNFAWVVPEDSTVARIGVMANVNPSDLFEKFFKRRMEYPLNVESKQISDRIGDVIRYGLIEKSVSNNVILVGDAAAQVKPFSAGGLIYGQIGARYAGSAVVRALNENNFSEKFLMEHYDKRWKSELEKGIERGLMVKKIFSVIEDSSFTFGVIKNLKLAKIASLLDVDFIGKG